MKKEFKDKVSKMDARYRHAYQDLDKIFKRMGEKDTYFIIQKYYKENIPEEVYRPDFRI